MPSPTKPGTTRVLVQIPDDIHARAGTRRRREGVTWSRVISTLLERWAVGDDASIAKPVKVGRPATPEAAEAKRLHQHWMATDDGYRRACTEPVDITKLVRFRSPGELFAAHVPREGRTVTREAVAAVDADRDDGVTDG